jgi:hypothetical protein
VITNAFYSAYEYLYYAQCSNIVRLIELGKVSSDELHCRAMNQITQDFKLKPATIDWATKKTQVVVGAGIAAVAVIGLHLGTYGWGLALGLFDCALIAVIAAEITGPYGNRLGTAASVWAAVLFAAAVPVTSSQDAAILPLYLLSIFGYLRYRSAKEKLLLRGALLASMLGLLTSVVSTTVPMIVLAAEVFLPTTDPTGTSKRSSQNWFAVLLFFLALAFVGSVGQLAPKMVPMLNGPMLPTFDNENLRALLVSVPLPAIIGYIATALCGFLCGSARVFAFCMIWMLAVSSNSALLNAPFAIMLSTAALPVTRAIPKRTATIVTYVGLVALTLVALGQLR